MRVRWLAISILMSLVFLGMVFQSYNQFYTPRRQWANNNLIVLLTMTIDPKNTRYARRTDISQRIQDYRKSLKRWAKLPYKVIAIESSGYGNPFADILTNAKNIIYISEKTPHNPARGKGYGESHLIKYAMRDIIYDNNIYIMKVTGRYAPIDDMTELMDVLRLQAPTVLYRPHYSEWFVAKRQFYIDLAESCIEKCDDPANDIIGFESNLLEFAQANNAMPYNTRIQVIETINGSNTEIEQI